MAGPATAERLWHIRPVRPPQNRGAGGAGDGQNTPPACSLRTAATGPKGADSGRHGKSQRLKRAILCRKKCGWLRNPYSHYFEAMVEIRTLVGICQGIAPCLHPACTPPKAPNACRTRAERLQAPWLQPLSFPRRESLWAYLKRPPRVPNHPNWPWVYEGETQRKSNI